MAIPLPLSGERGMTLVEMLVVLTIIGISAAAAVLSFRATNDGDGQIEARRLVARLQLAADTAMIGDRTLALALTPGGYQVMEHGDGTTQWHATAISGLAGPQALPSGIQISSTPDRPVLPLGADADGSSFALTLRKGQKHWDIAFDGITARLLAPAAAAQASRP